MYHFAPECWHNAAAESLFGNLSPPEEWADLLVTLQHQSSGSVRIFKYIEVFYN